MMSLLLILCVGTLDQVRQVDYLRFERMADSLGLAQHSVRSLLQDQDGYFWLGTYEGLHRLDGYQVTLFAPDTAPNTIGDDRVPSLFQDPSGQIWAGTATNGLWFYRGHGQGFEKVPGIEGCVRHLQSTAGGELLVGGCDGLFLVSQFRIRHRLFPKQTVTALTSLRENLHWVGVGQELYELDSRTMNVSLQGAFPQILALESVSREELWLGTEAGLIRRNLETGEEKRLAFTVNEKPVAVVDLFTDSRDNLWLSTKGAGLLVKRANQERFDQFRNNPRNVFGLGDDFIDFVKEDAFGSLWVASSSSGVFQRIAPDGLDLYFFRDIETPKNGVHCFEEIGDRIWVGTQKGLWILEADVYQAKDLGIGTQPIRDIEKVGNTIWMATRNGVYLFDQGGVLQRHFTQADRAGSLSHNLVRTLLQDTGGTLWLGTRNGLNRYQPENGRFEVFGEKEGLSNSSVFALYQYEDHLWIGTYRGLFRMHLPSRTIEQVRVGGQFIESGVTVMKIATDGSLWIGTHGKGLYRKGQAGEVDSWQKENGLGSNVVYGIQFDPDGTAWISTNQGIVAISPQGSMINYQASNGLQSNEFNAGAHFQDSTGTLYFGGLQGLNRFHPDHLQSFTKPPKVRITQVALLRPDGTFQAVQDEVISLKQTAFKGIRISFSSFQFRHPNQAQFAYRLKETDPWTQVGNSQNVLLTALDPGEYLIQAKGSDQMGQWSESPDRVTLSLRPPFYKTLAFQITTFLLLVLFANLSYILIRRLVRLIAHWKRTSFVGPYKILEKVGMGGMSEVYRAKNVHNQEIVALKVLHTDMSELARQRFFRESLICETLNHPNVVKVLAKGEHNGQCYLALEFIPGKTLATYFEAHQPSLQFAVTLFRCLVEILREMHQQGVVHRDLKPENIMLDTWVKSEVVEAASLKTHIRILDFGISKLVEDTFTQTSYFMGTLMYLPPEILLNSNQVTHGDYDFYSLAMTLHELITSQRPFSGEHAFDVIGQVLNKNLENLHHFNPDIPHGFASLIEDMTAKDPGARLADATTILTRLQRLPEDFFGQITPLKPQKGIPGTLSDQKQLFAEMETLSGMSEAQQQAYLEGVSRENPTLAQELRELLAIPSDALDDVLSHPHKQ